MKSKFMTAMVAFFFAWPLLAEESWRLTSTFLRLPPGSSTWTYLLPESRFVSPFRISYGPSSYCRPIKFQAKVRYKGTSEFTAATLTKDLFYTADKAVDGLQITSIHNNIQVQECEITVDSYSPQGGLIPPPVPVPPQPVRVYAGLLEHNGGFAYLKPVSLNSTYYAREFEVVIPDYCQGFEIQEFGVRVGGNLILAERIRSRTSLFRLPQITYVPNIEVSVLAPVGQNCQAPIYVYFE